jgi:hypothetical protein
VLRSADHTASLQPTLPPPLPLLYRLPRAAAWHAALTQIGQFLLNALHRHDRCRPVAPANERATATANFTVTATQLATRAQAAAVRDATGRQAEHTVRSSAERTRFKAPARTKDDLVIGRTSGRLRFPRAVPSPASCTATHDRAARVRRSRIRVPGRLARFERRHYTRSAMR